MPSSPSSAGPESPTLSFGELAARAGVRTSAIRYYESVGLLPPAPRAGRYRRFSPETVQLIATLRFAQRMRRALREGMRCGCLRVEDCVGDGDAGRRLPGPATSRPTAPGTIVPLGRAPRRGAVRAAEGAR